MIIFGDEKIKLRITKKTVNNELQIKKMHLVKKKNLKKIKLNKDTIKSEVSIAHANNDIDKGLNTNIINKEIVNNKSKIKDKSINKFCMCDHSIEIQQYIEQLENESKPKSIDLKIKEVQNNYIEHDGSEEYTGILFFNNHINSDSNNKEAININLSNIYLKNDNEFLIFKNKKTFNLTIYLKKKYNISRENIENIDLFEKKNFKIYIIQINNIKLLSNGINSINLSKNQKLKGFSWRTYIDFYTKYNNNYLYQSILNNTNNLHTSYKLFAHLEKEEKITNFFIELKDLYNIYSSSIELNKNIVN